MSANQEAQKHGPTKSQLYLLYWLSALFYNMKQGTNLPLWCYPKDDTIFITTSDFKFWQLQGLYLAFHVPCPPPACGHLSWYYFSFAICNFSAFTSFLLKCTWKQVLFIADFLTIYITTVCICLLNYLNFFPESFLSKYYDVHIYSCDIVFVKHFKFYRALWFVSLFVHLFIHLINLNIFEHLQEPNSLC